MLYGMRFVQCLNVSIGESNLMTCLLVLDSNNAHLFSNLIVFDKMASVFRFA
jgi:hypothetical protein